MGELSNLPNIGKTVEEQLFRVGISSALELKKIGAKEMLLVDEVDNKELLTGLINAMYEELPTPKSKKKK